jgi:PAS domain S-box-containing protein
MYVLNETPRVWTEPDVRLVKKVAERTWAALERAKVEAELRESEARLRLAQEASELGVFERDFVTGRTLWSAANFRLWGLQPDHRFDAPGLDEYQALIVPEDRDAHRNERIAQRSDPTVLRFASEFRVRRADTGEIRWLSSRGEYVRDAEGRALLLRGTNQDVTGRKTAEERQTLLAREVDHRAKNALAVVQSVVLLTPAQEPVAFRRAIEGRISALARAQTLLAGDRWRGADLHALLKGEIAAFRSDGQRVTLEGPPIMLPAGAAQPMAMAIHELATNAVKHGALSASDGSVAVSWHVEHGPPDRLHMRWVEAGGPQIVGKPQRRGFGTRVLQGTVASQLGGTVKMDWPSEGMVCTLSVPLRGAPAPPEGPGRRGGTLMRHRQPPIVSRRRAAGSTPG